MLPDFRLETFFSRWEFTARYHMCASDMESLSLRELLALGSDKDRANWDSLRLGYTETFGAPALRAAIAATYQRVSPAEVLTFAGAEEGIFTAMQCLLQPGDHAIVITPNYQSAETIPASICDVTGVPLDADNDWDLDIDLLRQAVRRNTKVISINFPHNPTGKIIARDILDEVVQIASRAGIYVFSDEVYRLIERNEAARLPQIADCYERGLSLNVMSKAYGLPGLRIGWIATQDKALLGRMERTKHYLSICNSAPGELLALIALRASDAILSRNRKIVAGNLELLNAFFDEYDDLFSWQVPDGGCIGYPQYLGKDGVENFCEQLVEASGVLLLPASVFRSALGKTPDDRFRIGYGRLHAAEGLAAMRAFIDEQRQPIRSAG
jgi:aspartate/methionine/tyrosine aminotransferase